MPELKDFIAIGKIVKTIGIKGNLKIIPLTDFPDRFYKTKNILLFNEKNSSFYANKNSGGYDFSFSECKVFDKYINVKFVSFDTIEKSRELINLLVLVNEKERIKLEDGLFYYYDLIDFEIYDNDKLIGRLVSVLNYGSGDLFNINYEDREILIPYNKEFVKKIDMEKKRIDVQLIEGFLD